MVILWFVVLADNLEENGTSTTKDLAYVDTYLGPALWFLQYAPSLARSSLGKRLWTLFLLLHKTLPSLSFSEFWCIYLLSRIFII